MKVPQIKTAEAVKPSIYAYTTPGVTYHDGWTKIGYTEDDVAKRIYDQTHTAGIKTNLEWTGDAFFPLPPPPRYFKDHAFHAYLQKREVEREGGTEWFRITGSESKKEFDAFRASGGEAKSSIEKIPYELRQEQADAVDKAATYFAAHPRGEYLWNAKPRFGKTLAAYDLAVNRLKAGSILIVTNRPAIANSWFEDYLKFVGQDSLYKFIGETDELKNRAGSLTREAFLNLPYPEKGCWRAIEFTSLQNLKGSKYFCADGGFDKLKEIAEIDWDILIIDEAHEGVDTLKTDVAFDRIKRKRTLHLTGTPFKALAAGKFPQEAIFNWTYADEQKRKKDWDEAKEGKPNPYAELPKINLYTYKMSDAVLEKVREGVEINGEQEDWAYDLGEFFKTNANGVFVHDEAVDRFLDALVKQKKFPFSTPELRDELKHTFWLLNRVDSVKALEKKLKAHEVFGQYKIVVAAGDGRTGDDEDEGSPVAAQKSYEKVMAAIRDYDKTITLSVRQLTTGVTVPEWTGVMMLSNISSAAQYMQTAFRAQNPCLRGDGAGGALRKTDCYVFDFDPARTLDIYAQFAVDLYSDTSGGRGDGEQRESRIRTLLNFFPVIGEGEDDELVALDAEKVLSIPQKIRAGAIVRSGFRSNFLFDNISRVFGAPKPVLEIIERISAKDNGAVMPDIEEIEKAKRELGVDEDGKIAVADDFVNGKATELFGEKIFGERIETGGADVKEIVAKVKEEVIAPIVAGVKDAYNAHGDEVKPSVVKKLEKRFEGEIEGKVKRIVDDGDIKRNTIEAERQMALAEAGESRRRQEEVNRRFDRKVEAVEAATQERLESAIKEISEIAQRETVLTVETKRRETAQNAMMEGVRTKLRSFASTIPSFLMASVTEDVTLDNFDSIVSDADFKDLTGITKEEFRLLRDGGTLNGEKFEGKLFSESDFNAAVQEFMRERKAWARWFDAAVENDIFIRIPPPKTNQIFTPRRVVAHMVDLLEKENPGCFDNPESTFADLYMKSGMFIAEIVRRLYRSDGLKAAYPDDEERLRHIFARQVYGLAPTEIIYRICLNFLLGFATDGAFTGSFEHNFRLADAQKKAADGTLNAALDRLYGK